MRKVNYKRISYYSYDGPLDEPNIYDEARPLDQFLMLEHLFRNAIQQIGVIPPLHIINATLLSGKAGGCYEWPPFEIDKDEYDALIILLIKSSEGYIIEDKSLYEHKNYGDWETALLNKFKENPTYKPIERWYEQNKYLGIPIGEKEWISRQEYDINAKKHNLDPIIRPIAPFLRKLEIACFADCCGLSAFVFYPDEINDNLSQQDKFEFIDKLQQVYISLDDLPEKKQLFQSEILNDIIAREELEKLLTHIDESISKA